MLALVLLILATLSGICSHVFFFIHGEWESKITTLFTFYMGAEVFLMASTFRACAPTIVSSLVMFISTNLAYLCGLFGSMTIYRVYFHRLRHFPGPRPAQVSALWSLYRTIPNFRFYKIVHKLHLEHGDFVRIRPREISICHVDAVHDIHGVHSGCLKGTFYDINYPARSLQMTRDKAFHSQRRRIWDKGFTARALIEYQPRVTEHCLKLVSQLSKRLELPINVPDWMSYFGFDVMGDLAFGKSFNMLDEAGDQYTLSLLKMMQTAIGIISSAPWLFMMFQKLPLVNLKRLEWLRWCAAQVRSRQKMGKSRQDLFSYILGDEGGSNLQISNDDLMFDSELAIIAGSDTTSSTLAALLYLLAKHPEKLALLQAEMDNLFAPGEDISYQRLVKAAPFLHGCINEALRLYPAVPGGVQRVTPAGGVKISGRWIPEDTVVSFPIYTLHRDPRYFDHPDSFIPERWSSQPELIRNGSAFSPFLLGQYSCVGKNLAYMEMRLLVYFLVKNLDFGFPPGSREEVEDVFDGPQGFKDFFVLRPPAFALVFSRREYVER
ncbi:cytochrome P450 [Aspergillus ambiguus]|uniref:cytochrome P450 n=1 Tax=Aspergillus ambiguus TaxID=176160 RepID=UPI003CCCDC59